MDSLWRITRDTFALFDPDRELDKVLERVRSHKIALVLRYWNNLRNGPRLPARPTSIRPRSRARYPM